MKLTRFFRDERASISVEIVVCLTVLLWAYAVFFMWWDGFRTAMKVEKATYTVSDLMSRELGMIDQAYVDGMNTMFGFLTNEDDGTSMRVSVVSRKLQADGVTEYNALEWSHVSGTGFAPHTDMTAIDARIPMMGLGAQVVVVETHLVWDPAIRSGLPDMDASTLVVTSPRYLAQVLWDDGTS